MKFSQSNLATRKHYRIYQSITDPKVCVRESLVPGGAREDLLRYYEGWRITHDLLKPCAPFECRLVSGDRIEMEFIDGLPLNRLYGLALASPNGTQAHCPWKTLLERLPHVWSSTRLAPTVTNLSAASLWTTWFGIAELRLAKRYTWQRCWEHPLWSAEALSKLIKGKILYGSFTAVPKVATEIMTRSREGLLLGDIHFENLVGSPERLSFVDFTEVTRGPIALDLTPLWFEWWLAQGLPRGDDGFLSHFRELWNQYVGPQILLCEMTREWIKRLFSWLSFTFYQDRLHMAPDRALQFGQQLAHLKEGVDKKVIEARTLEDLL